VLVVGLCAGIAAVVITAVLPRIGLAALTKRPNSGPPLTTIPSTGTGSSQPHSTTTSSTVATTTTQVSSTGGNHRSDRPAGLIQVSGSKTICITDPPGPALQAVELATGLTYNCIETFTDDATTWAEWVHPWIVSSSVAFRSWVAADPTGHQLIDSQNLIPDNYEVANPNWTADCAAGDYNGYATQFATAMVSAGFGYSVIRLGHEMNGTWDSDSLGNNPTQWGLWAHCFAQEVTAMRAVPGSHFLFDWSINQGYRNIPLADYYPGNSYVDIVGISFYDQSGNPLPPVGSPDRWQVLTAEPMGLDAVNAFAVQHHKPLSIPEWGTVSTQGDNATYVTNTANFISSNDVTYQAWFDAGLYNINRLSAAAPHSLAAYIRTIGKGR
jgi:hypothetical protein